MHLIRTLHGLHLAKVAVAVAITSTLMLTTPAPPRARRPAAADRPGRRISC